MVDSPLNWPLSGYDLTCERHPLRMHRCLSWRYKAAQKDRTTVPNQDIRRPSRSGGRWSSFLGAALTILVFAAAFCLVQRLAFTLRFPPFQRTTIWTPGALVFAALLLTPVRRWWIYYAGLCLGLFTAYYGDSAIPVATAMLAAQVHFGAVAISAWGLRQFSSKPPFANLTSLLVFFAIAAVFIPVSTTAPVDVVRYISGADDVWPVALRSVLAIALGMLIATPALTLTTANGLRWFRLASRRDYLEVVVLAGGLVVAGYFCFSGPSGATASPALLYAPLPLLLWAAARFELGPPCRDAARSRTKRLRKMSFSYNSS
jgi:integral membrane sensor domain MASE1